MCKVLTTTPTPCSPVLLGGGGGEIRSGTEPREKRGVEEGGLSSGLNQGCLAPRWSLLSDLPPF